MAELTHTSIEIEDIFREVVCTIFGLGPESNHDRIRFPWGSDLLTGVGSAPDWDHMADVCFIYALPHDDAYNRQRNRRNVYRDGPDMVQLDEHTDVHNILFVNYGPNAYECARGIRDGLFRNDIRAMLKGNRFSIVTDVPAPRRIPELYDGEWWNRVDLNATFYEFVRLESPMRTIRKIRFDISFPTRTGDVSGGAEARRPSCNDSNTTGG